MRLVNKKYWASISRKETDLQNDLLQARTTRNETEERNRQLLAERAQLATDIAEVWPETSTFLMTGDYGDFVRKMHKLADRSRLDHDNDHWGKVLEAVRPCEPAKKLGLVEGQPKTPPRRAPVRPGGNKGRANG